MRVVEEADGERRTLAEEVELADSIVSKGLGLMFRCSIPDDYALVFRFDRAKTRRLHMLCVPFDIDAVWLIDGEIEAIKRLSAWTGRGRARADTVIEMPAGAAEKLEVGQRLHIEG